MSEESPKRQRLTFQQQLKVIQVYRDFKIHGSREVLLRLRSAGFTTICMQTVFRYIREEESIRQYVEEHSNNQNRSSRAKVTHPNLEKALWAWIQDAEHRRVHLTGDLIKAKARRLSIDMGIQPHEMIDFSDGWLARFKHRYGIKERIFHGEAASAPIELIEPSRKILHKQIAQFSLWDVVNVDETAHYSSQMTNRGLASQPLSGSKVDKTRLTIVLGTSAAGWKLPPFIIGKAARPRAFTHGTPADYGYWYEFNKSAWMTAEIWHRYLTSVNDMARNANRRLLLICDNASSHKAGEFSHLTVAFLPPNLTSHLQPMDAGIIRNFKGIYRKLLNERALDLDLQGVADPYKVNQRESMHLLTRAWNEVSDTTIKNCWRHTGILPPEDPERELRDMFTQARL
ncbi:CENP-B ARS binding protein-like protein [Rhizoctonia solani]|uniref:CENP-B ARS binding protein-like protein n=1 Tax=Rhizoctonia solani TaxID=456999 RepID=A0A8H7GZ50_9AGAM|nr:CENP-B ARS binding protein-like protein [Rhizoctonia solani]